MPGVPEVPTAEAIKPEDIIQEKGGVKEIPIEERYPPQAEAYRDQEAIKKGEVAKPIDEKRFKALSEAVVGTFDNPAQGAIRRVGREFFDRDPASLEFKHSKKLQGQTLPSLKQQYLASNPTFIREAVFAEYVATVEKEIAAAFRQGRSSLGELSSEEQLTVEALFGFPRVLWIQHWLEKYEATIGQIKRDHFQGLKSAEILERERELEAGELAHKLTPEQQVKLQAARVYEKSLDETAKLRRGSAYWQQNLYKFIISNQNNPLLAQTMELYFSAFESLDRQRGFKEMVGERFLQFMPKLQVGALAPLTAAKALEQIGITIYLPANLRSDTDHGIDLLTRFGPEHYLIFQVKHDNETRGVEIDGQMSYNRYGREVRRLAHFGRRYQNALGRTSQVVPRFAVVGKVWQVEPHTGLVRQDEAMILSGLTTAKEILEGRRTIRYG